VFDEPDWIALAADAFQAVTARLGTGTGGLRHAWRDGRRLELGLLDDHAQMARAALALFEATAEQVWMERTEELMEAAERDFADPAGGYRLTAGDATDLLVRPKTAHDGPTPAPLATFLECLALLHALDGRPHWRERADRLVRSVAGEVTAQPAGHGAFLAAVMALEAPIQVVLVAQADAGGVEPLRRVALTTALPHRTVQLVPDGAVLPTDHPAHGKAAVEGHPTAYVCVAATCTPPITDPAALSGALRAAALRVGAMSGN
jgi:uncharacterized protein YyaL (SSP411 family)